MKNSVLVLLTVLSLGCVSRATSAAGREVETVASVDLGAYLGTWYEIAAIPQSFQKDCVSNVSAEYQVGEEGLIKVLNSCQTADGTRKIAEGRAKVVDTATNSKLKVTFVKFLDWIFSFGGDYWIMDLPLDYSHSVVVGPGRDYAWILSRTPELSQQTLVQIRQKLEAQGFDACQLMMTLQSQGNSQKQTLCEAAK